MKPTKKTKERNVRKPQGQIARIEEAILALADMIECGEWMKAREIIRSILGRI